MEDTTKYTVNGQVYWGYCQENCSGETIGPKSDYNLANQAFSNLCDSTFFDLCTWESGVCRTYNPPETSSQGLQNRLYFMLGNKELDDYGMLFGFDIYIHEKDNSGQGLTCIRLGSLTRLSWN